MVVNTILGYLGSYVGSYFCKKNNNNDKLQKRMVISLFFNNKFQMRYNNINLLHFIFLLHQ